MTLIRSEQSSLFFTSARNTCFMTRKTTRDRVRKRARKFIDLHPFRIQPPPAGPFCAPYRRTYLPTVEMTPDGTCFTHDARIDGIGKKRARDYTGGLKSAASVNREFYHGRVLSLENCPTNLIATRESHYSREHTRAWANRKNVCLREDRFQTVSALNFLDRVADQCRQG